MSLTCENCGCKLDHGICSNCHEESYILEFQGEFIDSPLSNEFLNKVKEQEEEIQKNRKKYDYGDF